MANTLDAELDQSSLWPSTEYYQAVERLKRCVGQPLYVVEINAGEINAGVKFTDQPLVLLGIVDYPAPDPYKQLCPHMLILNDGRGVNLGRIARISLETAFQPKPEQVVFQHQSFVQEFLFAPRSLSHESIRQTSRLVFSHMLGDTPGLILARAAQEPQRLEQFQQMIMASKAKQLTNEND